MIIMFNPLSRTQRACDSSHPFTVASAGAHATIWIMDCGLAVEKNMLRLVTTWIVVSL